MDRWWGRIFQFVSQGSRPRDCSIDEYGHHVGVAGGKQNVSEIDDNKYYDHDDDDDGNDYGNDDDDDDDNDNDDGTYVYVLASSRSLYIYIYILFPVKLQSMHRDR